MAKPAAPAIHEVRPINGRQRSATPVNRFELLLQVAVIVLLCIGCWLVLRPFFSAVLFAAVVAVTVWPLFASLQRPLPNSPGVAAAAVCVVVVGAIVGPVAVLALSLGDTLHWLLQLYDRWIAGGSPAPPQWLLRIPLIGASLEQHWRALAADGLQSELLMRNISQPLRSLVLQSGRGVASGLLQAGLAVLVLYLLLIRGESLGRRLQALALRLGGELGPTLLNTARQTVLSVMLGLIGTATAQAAVAVLGFTIAGVPHPLLLGSATFLLSMVPIGPPLIWGGASLWLMQHQQAGWAGFMVAYGLLCISSIDNLVKPYLISVGTHLPFVVTLLGVLGGLIAFGFIGLFLGPVLLALALNLTTHWLAATRS
jgi:predicted PurR-regulated permease PerM